MFRIEGRMSENPALSMSCLKPLVLLEKHKCGGQMGEYIGLSPSRGTCREPCWLKTSMPAVMKHIWAHYCKDVQ